jgi:hypothetical protein
VTGPVSASGGLVPMSLSAEQVAATRSAIRGFAEEFPGVVVWLGLWTRHWWAMVPVGGGVLVEAANVASLRQRNDRLRNRPGNRGRDQRGPMMPGAPPGWGGRGRSRRA